MSLPDLVETQVLVTGGAGFIGSHLVDALLEQRAKVRVLDNLTTGSVGNLQQCAGAIEFVEGDIRNRATCRDAAVGCRYVFHQAALGSVPRSMEDPATTFEVNVQGTVNVIAAAKDAGVDRIVYASSSSVYGDSEQQPKREGSEGRQLSPYAATKQMNELTAEVFDSSYELDSIGLRYFNIYGARQDPEGPYAAVIPRFFTAALTGNTMTIYGDGEQSRDFTHITDAVQANLLAAGAVTDACGHAYNIAAGQVTTVNDLAHLVTDLCESDWNVEYLEARQGDVRHSLADLDRAREALEFRPVKTLTAGLEATMGFYRCLLEV